MYMVVCKKRAWLSQHICTLYKSVHFSVNYNDGWKGWMGINTNLLCFRLLSSVNWWWSLSSFSSNISCRWWWKNETYFLKLKKNLYGTRQEGENWFDVSKNWIWRWRFQTNKKVYPYIFLRNNCILICYVYDCCIFSIDN